MIEMDEQQKVLNSPFDLETHKKTFIAYLEVIIDSEGNVMYAVPSHQQAMIRIATEKLNVTKERLFEMYDSSWFDTIEWLSGITGCISVWFDNYVGEPNEKQLDVLRKFRDEGIYVGPTYNKYVKSKELLNAAYGSSSYPSVEAMRRVSDDIINKLKEEIKERTLNLPKTSMEIKRYGYLDTDMCYNIYEMFSESKKLSLKSVVEWNRKCDRIDYTKDVKVSFRFPIFHEYGHIAELTSYCLNDVIFNQNNESVRQHMFTEKMNQESNFRKFIRRKSK